MYISINFTVGNKLCSFIKNKIKKSYKYQTILSFKILKYAKIKRNFGVILMIINQYLLLFHLSLPFGG